MAQGELRHHKMTLHQPRLKRRVCGRVCFIDRCSENRDRAPASFERFLVSRGVNPGGQAADDHDVALDQGADEFRYPFPTWERCLSRTDDGDASVTISGGITRAFSVAMREKSLQRARDGR